MSAVFIQRVTSNVDQIRCLECPTDATSLHLEIETLSGDKTTVCLTAVEVEEIRDDLGEWLMYIDEHVDNMELGEP